MEYVSPIKDPESIQRMKDLLKSKSQRDFLLFVFGINTGMRICDLLNLKVQDVWNGKEVTEFVVIPGNGHRKEKTFYLNNNVRNAIFNYVLSAQLKSGDFLFKTKNHNKPITRQQAYRIVNKAARDAGIEGKIGTHTIRKTFGYHAYRKGVAISVLSAIFDHSCPAETLKYLAIGKEQDLPKRIDVNL